MNLQKNCPAIEVSIPAQWAFEAIRQRFRFGSPTRTYNPLYPNMGSVPQDAELVGVRICRASNRLLFRLSIPSLNDHPEVQCPVGNDPACHLGMETIEYLKQREAAEKAREAAKTV